MNHKLLGVAAAGLLLSACTHAYPDLATFKTLNPVPTDSSDELGVILHEAATLQASYSTGYKETAKWQDISQLPIIGLAGIAAWVLLNNHENAAKKAGKIGIVALSYSGARDQLTAKGMPDAYIAGHGALTCILAEGSQFSGQNATTRHDAFARDLTGLTAQIEWASLLRHVEPDPKKIGQYGEMLKAARALADQAIAAGRTAETGGFTQEGAFQGAAPAFRKAISSVSVRVASKGRVRPPLDFANLRDQMAAPKAPGVQSNGRRSLSEVELATLVDNPARLIDEIVKASNELMTATAKMSKVTPDYVKSLERVQGECVNLAPQ